MKTKLILLILCVTCLAGCSQEVKKMNAEKIIRNDSLVKLRIDSLRENEVVSFKKGNYLDFYEKALKIDSNEVSFKISHAYSIAHYKNDKSGALNELKSLFRKYPNNPELLFAYGTIIYSSNVDSAFSYCEKALTIEPKNWINWYYLSRYYDEQKLYDKAIQSINKAIKINPKKVELVLLRGSYKMGFEDYKNAYQDLDTIPNNFIDPNVYYNRANCLYYLEKYDLAISDCNQYLKLTKQPESEIYIIRAYSKLGINKKVEAFEDLKKAREMGNTNGDDVYNKLVEYFKTNKN